MYIFEIKIQFYCYMEILINDPFLSYIKSFKYKAIFDIVETIFLDHSNNDPPDFLINRF